MLPGFKIWHLNPKLKNVTCTSTEQFLFDTTFREWSKSVDCILITQKAVKSNMPPKLVPSLYK